MWVLRLPGAIGKGVWRVESLRNWYWLFRKCQLQIWQFVKSFSFLLTAFSSPLSSICDLQPWVAYYCSYRTKASESDCLPLNPSIIYWVGGYVEVTQILFASVPHLKRMEVNSGFYLICLNLITPKNEQHNVCKAFGT